MDARIDGKSLMFAHLLPLVVRERLGELLGIVRSVLAYALQTETASFRASEKSSTAMIAPDANIDLREIIVGDHTIGRYRSP